MPLDATVFASFCNASVCVSTRYGLKGTLGYIVVLVLAKQVVGDSVGLGTSAVTKLGGRETLVFPE